MNERLKKLRKKLDITQQEFADRIGIKRNSFANYEIGRNKPIDAIIKSICREFNVNEEWLRNGTGEMFNKKTSFSLDAYAETNNLTEAEKKLLFSFMELDPEIRESIYSIFKKAFYNHDSTQGTITKESPPFRIIQYYQRLASAGKGEYLFDDIPADTIKVKDTPVSRKADFVIGINGNSMEPDYHDGEKVFVEKTAGLEIGEVGIFVRGEECFIKELGKNGLISKNEEYPLITPSEDIRVVGKVTGKVEE